MTILWAFSASGASDAPSGASADAPSDTAASDEVDSADDTKRKVQWQTKVHGPVHLTNSFFCVGTYTGSFLRVSRSFGKSNL